MNKVVTIEKVLVGEDFNGHVCCDMGGLWKIQVVHDSKGCIS